MKYPIIIIAVLAVMGCSNDFSPNLPTTEKWVEIGTRTDTLSFETWESMGMMLLNRGREHRNGHDSPKYWSGPYEYTLLKIPFR